MDIDSVNRLLVNNNLEDKIRVDGGGDVTSSLRQEVLRVVRMGVELDVWCTLLCGILVNSLVPITSDQQPLDL